MATALDVEMLAAAIEILDEVGVPATVISKAQGAYDVSTGLRTVVETTFNIAKVSPPLRYNYEEIDGVTVISGDFKVIIARETGLVIKNGDEITINNKTAMIKSTSPIYSGEEVAVYIAQCRAGSS